MNRPSDIPLLSKISALLTLAGLWLMSGTAAATDASCDPEKVLPDNLFPSVKLETTMGDIVLELDRRRAPITAANFICYVQSGHYDNTVFHRVIADFMIQGGGYTPAFEEKPFRDPIVNESGNGLSNRHYSISMARYNEPHTATAQFFINVSDNKNLDPSTRRWGYAVFGMVTSGQSVVDAIGVVPTDFNADLGAPDVPVTQVLLRKVSIISAEEAAAASAAQLAPASEG